MVTTRSQSRKNRHYTNSDSDEFHCSSLHSDEGNTNSNTKIQNDNKNSRSGPLNGNAPAEEQLGRGCRTSRPQRVSYDMMYMSKVLSTRKNMRRREDEDENGELLIHSRYPEREAAKRAVERMSFTMHKLDKEDSAMTNEHSESSDGDSAGVPVNRNGRGGNMNNRTNTTYSQRAIGRFPSFSQRKRERDSSMDSSITNESLREVEDEKPHAERSSSEPLATPTCDAATRRAQQQRAKEAVEKNVPINQCLSRAIADDPAEAKRRSRHHTENVLLGLDAPLPTATPHPQTEGSPLLGDVTPLRIDSSVTFAQVGGLPGHVVMLREMVLFPLLYPELLRSMNLTPPRGVLFVGPPGTGKTLIARALANEGTHCAQRKVTFFMRKGADILSKWVGESERQLCLLFEEAKRQQPSIIFFDELDGLAPVRHTKSEQSQAALVSTFLALLDGLDDRGQVIVIGATNRPDTIDPALRRPGRFDRELYFPLPDAAARRHILTIVTRPLLPEDHPQREEILTELTARSEGWSGAEIQSLCVEAGMNRLRTALPQLYTTSRRLRVPPGALVIQKEDFFLATHRVQSSVRRGAAAAAVNRLDEHLEHLLDSARTSILSHVGSIWPNAAAAMRRERRDCSDAADAVQELSSFVIPHTTNPLLLFLVPEISFPSEAAADVATTEFATEKAAVALVKAMPSIRTFAVHLPHLVVDYTSIHAGTSDAGQGMFSEGPDAVHGPAGPGEGNSYTSGHIHTVIMAILRATGPSIVLFHGLDVWLAEFGLVPPGRSNSRDSGSNEATHMDAEEREGRRRQMTVFGYYIGLLRSADVLIVAPSAYTGVATHIAQFIGGGKGIGRMRSVECAVPIVPAEADLVRFTRYIFRVVSLALDHCVQASMEELPEDSTPPPLPSLEVVRATRRREVDLWRRVEHRRRQLRYVLIKWVGQYLDSRRFSMFLSADLDFAAGHDLLAAWQRHTHGRRVGLLDVMEKLENEEYTCLSQYHDDIDRLVRNVRSFFRTRSAQDQRYRSRALELKEMTVLNLYKINRNVVRFCEEHRSLTEPDVFSSSSSSSGSHASGLSTHRRGPKPRAQQQQPLVPIASEETRRRPPKRYRYFGQRRRHRLRNRQPVIKTVVDDAPHVINGDEDNDDGNEEDDEERRRRRRRKEENEEEEEEENHERGGSVADGQRVGDMEGNNEVDGVVRFSANSSMDVTIDATVQRLKGLTFLQLHRLFQSAMPMLEEEIGKRRRRQQQQQQQQGQTQQTKREDEQEGTESALAFFERMIYESLRESRNSTGKNSTPDRGSSRPARNSL